MRMMPVVVLLISAMPVCAQSFDTGTADVRFGVLQGGDDITSVRAGTELFWENGAIDLQLGASIAQLGEDAAEGAVRIIASHALKFPLRLGLSVALIPDDMIRTNVVSYGLHGLYQTPSQTLEVAFMIPDHIGSTGAFSFDIDGEQRLTDDLSITTHLYRRSTDPEVPDFYSIGLGGSYALTDRLTFVGEAFQTVTDVYDVENNGGRIGIEYQLSPRLELTASLINVVPVRGDGSTGLSIAARFDFGDHGEPGRLFRVGAIPDRFEIANF